MGIYTSISTYNMYQSPMGKVKTGQGLRISNRIKYQFPMGKVKIRSGENKYYSFKVSIPYGKGKANVVVPLVNI